MTGLSFEYQAYNITGFTLYSIYCIVTYWAQHHYDLTTSVEINDICFSLHAVLITCVIIWQCYTYKLSTQTINKYHVGIVIIMWILVIYNVVLCIFNILPWVDTTSSYQYSLMEYFGYVKVAISFIKYTPQVYINWKRQCTVGWSIGNVLLDFSGGFLSFCQQGLQAYEDGNTSVFTSNIAKLLLAIESMLFDIIFIIQHYILYKSNNKVREKISREEEEAEERAKQSSLTDTSINGGVSPNHGHEQGLYFQQTTPLIVHSGRSEDGNNENTLSHPSSLTNSSIPLSHRSLLNQSDGRIPLLNNNGDEESGISGESG